METETQTIPPEIDNDTSTGNGVVEIGALPPGTILTEAAVAKLFGKCAASIKSAVERGELPRSTRIMGKPCWTVRAIVAHVDAALEREARKFARLQTGN